VNLSSDLQPDDLTTAAASFGIGAEWDVGLGSFNGSVPPIDSAADGAAASIGQGRVQASPLGMAMVAATVAAGRWKAPRVVAEPAAESPPAEIPLDPTEAEYLRDMMLAVVLDGTATGSLGGLPGEVFAKTGTAEFGSGENLRTNAWIIGWRGDVAFCAFVEGGSGGGGVAGPIAASFLNAYGG
jgi:cell division protein FtsI/penicillin-binding protein 2